MTVEVEQTPDDGSGWVGLSRISRRDYDGVDACARALPAGDWHWGVFVQLAEFERSDKFGKDIEDAIATVSGVASVRRTDTEVWEMTGQLSGAELVQAIAATVDKYLDAWDETPRAKQKPTGATGVGEDLARQWARPG